MSKEEHAHLCGKWGDLHSFLCSVGRDGPAVSLAQPLVPSPGGVRTAEQDFSPIAWLRQKHSQPSVSTFVKGPNSFFLGGKKRRSRPSVQPSAQALLSEEDKPPFPGLVTPASATLLQGGEFVQLWLQETTHCPLFPSGWWYTRAHSCREAVHLLR